MPGRRADIRARATIGLLIVIAILLIVAVASEIFIRDVLHPHSLFAYLLFTTLLSGLAATAIIERLNVRLFHPSSVGKPAGN